MAEACTCTENTADGGLHLIKWSWTSSATGNVTAASVTGRVTELPYTGTIMQFMTDPGSTAPTAAWDLTITDDKSIDVLHGQGTDRSATVTEYASDTSLLGHVINSKLTINVTNAGDSKVGIVWLWLKEEHY